MSETHIKSTDASSRMTSQLFGDAAERTEETERIVRKFEHLCGRGLEPDVREFWLKEASPTDLLTLSDLIKVDLRNRFDRGAEPEAGDYFSQFPELIANRDRVVSLIYEEYCLREEFDLKPSPDSFGVRYEPWRDSLDSQLRCHKALRGKRHAVGRPTFPELGSTFAQKYELCQILGEGAWARVYQAKEPGLGNRRVAIKVSRERGREPSIQARLNHEHIMPVLSIEHDFATGLRGLCMPYWTGRPLDQLIVMVHPVRQPRVARDFWEAVCDDADNPDATPESTSGWTTFPIRGSYADAVAWLGLKIARALQHAHDQSILHRDVKPANILLTHLHGPQLLDFNLAHDPTDADNAEAALQGGTLPYMAIEQLMAYLEPSRWELVGESADLFSLGMVLDEMLTGERPELPKHSGKELGNLIADLIGLRLRRRRLVNEVNPTVPHALAAIVAKCTHSDPAQRYPSAHALAEDLERFLKRAPLILAVNPSRTERARNLLTRHRKTFRVGSALVSIGLFGCLAMHAAMQHAGKKTWSHFVETNPSAIVKAAQDEMERLGSGPVKGIPAKEAQLEQIRKNLETATSLRKDLHAAHLMLGHIAFAYDKNYASSLEAYDRAIALMEARDDIKPRELCEARLNRATVHYGWANTLKRDARHAQLKSALSDLSIARAYFESLGTMDRIRFFYLAALVESELAGMAGTASDFQRCESLYALALKDVNQLEAELRLVQRGHALSAPSSPDHAKVQETLKQVELLRSTITQGQHVLADMKHNASPIVPPRRAGNEG